MKQEKAIARLFSGKKAFTLMLAVLLVLGCSVGATLAYLTATTNEVKNTFTVGKVAITLQEHQYVEASNTLNTTTVQGNTYKLIPGKNMPKDPFVTVAAGSEKCWLFVRIDEANNQDEEQVVTDKDIVRYEVDKTIWTNLPLTGSGYGDGIKVYYRIVDADTTDQKFYVLENDAGCADTNHANGCVTVSSFVTSSLQSTPVLKFTAAAIQYDGLEVVDGGVTGTDYTTQAAKAAFNNLPAAFKSTTNLNNTTPVTPTPVE